MVYPSRFHRGLVGGQAHGAVGDGSDAGDVLVRGALPVALDGGADLLEGRPDLARRLDVHSVGPLELLHVLWVEGAFGHLLLELDGLDDVSGFGQV